MHLNGINIEMLVVSMIARLMRQATGMDPSDAWKASNAKEPVIAQEIPRMLDGALVTLLAQTWVH